MKIEYLREGKMKVFKIFLVSIFMLMLPSLVLAADHYIRSGAGGNNSGSDWTNAYTSIPSTLVRGDTYYIADGNYSGTFYFRTAAAGSTYIYIKKATASQHGTNTGWSASYGDGVADFSGGWVFTSDYWDIDGVVGSKNSGHGIKLTSNGNTKMVTLSNRSHIRLSHIEFDHARNTGAGRDIMYVNSGTTPSTDLQFRYCYLHDCGRCPFIFRHVTNTIIEYCWIEKNHWNTTDHSEGISAYLGTGTTIVRHNTWVDITGTGTLMFAGDGWEIYGNLVYWTGNAPYSGHSDCAFGNWSGKDQATFGSSNTKIYNNTIVDITNGRAGIYMYAGETGNEARNNLWVNNRTVPIQNITSTNNTITTTTSMFRNYAGDDFTLAQALEPGYTLASPYNLDMDGKTRGSDGSWDQGAFEYGGGGAVVNERPSPPSGLRVLSAN